MKTLFEALNIAYREREKRSFVSLNLPLLRVHHRLPCCWPRLADRRGRHPVRRCWPCCRSMSLPDLLLRYARWPLLLLVAGLAIAILYPLRPQPRTRQLALDQLGAACLPAIFWLIASAGFSFYLQGFSPTTTPPMARSVARHRLHDVDVDIGDRPSGRCAAQTPRSEHSDRPSTRRAGKAQPMGPARRA